MKSELAKTALILALMVAVLTVPHLWAKYLLVGLQTLLFVAPLEADGERGGQCKP